MVVAPEMIIEAFGAESDRLSQVLADLDDAAFARASGCPPWTVADLAYHVLAVHGLDLAAALDRGPWMTPLAAEVTEELLLPAGNRLRADAGWDRVTLIAKLTGRCPATSAESALIEALGGQRLALG